MTHQTDLDNHANQLNPNHDEYRGPEPATPEDDNGDEGDFSSGTGIIELRPSPRTRTVNAICGACRKRSDMLAETVDAGFGNSWERAKCPTCGAAVKIDGEWGLRLL